MISGWRARLHYWSRHTGALKKLAFWIVAAGFGSAYVFVLLFPKTHTSLKPDPVDLGIRNGWQRLHRATTPDPRALSQWLRDLLSETAYLSEATVVDEPTWEAYQKDGRILTYDVRSVLQQHAGDPKADPARMFEDFLQAQLTPKEPTAVEAARRLQERAQLATPPPLANELHAAVLLRAENQVGALTAFAREGQLFPDATAAREEALQLAVDLKDVESLRAMVAIPGWMAGSSSSVQYQVGWELQDGGLIGLSLLRKRVFELPLVPALLSFFVGSLWYFILVLQSAPRSWRWLVPVAPILAGTCSVWPTLWIASWQEVGLGMSEHASFPDDLWYWVMGVGLREETAKLLLFIPFLPWLLRRRAPGLALMTGAFVGLGFAIGENINYYTRGGEVALGRFLTANFLHLAMTGIIAHGLYDMLRSRFARADRFIVTFLAVVAVHGVYDYAIGNLQMNFLVLILLAFTAWQFLDLVAHEAPGARQLVAPAAVFLVGMAILVSVVLWITAVQTGSVLALTATATECLGTLPLFFIYWRRLDGI